MPVRLGAAGVELIVIVPELAVDEFVCAKATTATEPISGTWDGEVYEIGVPLGHAETVVAVTAGTAGT
jgi:hypothetical protein